MSSAAQPEQPRLTVNQVGALVVLMAEASEVSNPRLRELAGVELTGRDRTRLKELGLIVESRRGNAYTFRLSDHGWRSCAELLAAQPRFAGAAAGALAVLLGGLHRSAQQRGTQPRALFEPEAMPDESPARSGPPPVKAEPPAQVAPADLATTIRSASRHLAKEPAGWVSLADLRDRLGALPRADVDAALRRLAVSPGVRLIPVANLKSLTRRDRDAALRLGGEENHAMAIEGS
ncbi:MAG TPA: hypothetical protein VF163_19765 [Micromonosporaceae bacterium]